MYQGCNTDRAVVSVARVAEPILYIEFSLGIPTHHNPSSFIVGLNFQEYAPGRKIETSLMANA